MTAHLAFDNLHVQRGGNLFEHTTAVFDTNPDTGQATYRYLLKAMWDTTRPPATWFGLNPSVATAIRPDTTASKIKEFSRRLGCGGYELLNLFALISTDPTGLADHHDPIGPRCDEIIDAYSRHTGPVIAAWGDSAPTALQPRIDHVLARLRAAGVPLLCLGTTRHGRPCHPSRLVYQTTFVPYRPEQED